MKETIIDEIKFIYEDENKTFNFLTVCPPITRETDRKFEDDLFHFCPDERRNSGFLHFYFETRSLEEFFDILTYLINRGWKKNLRRIDGVWQRSTHIKRVNFTIKNFSIEDFRDCRGFTSFSLRVDRKDIDKFRKDLKESGYILNWAEEDYIKIC